MKLTEAERQKLEDSITWEPGQSHLCGGQTCGMMDTSVILNCEFLDLKIKIGYSRSIIKNKELAFKMFSTH